MAVQLRDRPWAAVLADMVDGVIVTNQLTGVRADQVRSALWSALLPAETDITLAVQNKTSFARQNQKAPTFLGEGRHLVGIGFLHLLLYGRYSLKAAIPRR